jgi:hypothetical protein
MNRVIASLLGFATLAVVVHANPPARPRLPQAPAPPSHVPRADLYHLQEQQKRALEQLRKVHEEARRHLEENWKRQLHDLEHQKRQHEDLQKLRQEWQRRSDEARSRQEHQQRDARHRLQEKHKHELAHPSSGPKPGQTPHDVRPGKPPAKLGKPMLLQDEHWLKHDSDDYYYNKLYVLRPDDYNTQYGRYHERSGHHEDWGIWYGGRDHRHWAYAAFFWLIRLKRVWFHGGPGS